MSEPTGELEVSPTPERRDPSPGAALSRLSLARAAEVAVYNDADTWVTVFAQTVQLAKYVCDSEFVPKEMRGKPDLVAAAILTGREMRLGPMASLKHIHIVRGRPGMTAELMRAQALDAGHEILYPEQNDRRVIVKGRRFGRGEWTTVTVTADQVTKAGIALGAWPEDKLVARATSRLCRRIFADAMSGLPSVDEIEDGTDRADGEEEPIADPTSPTTRPGRGERRTAQRRPLSTGKPSQGAVSEPVPPTPTAPDPSPEPVADEPAYGPSGDGDDVVDADFDDIEPGDEPPESEEEAITRLQEGLGAVEMERPVAEMVTQPQLRALGVSFTKTLKVTSEGDRHNLTSGIVERAINSWSDLTKAEAITVIDRVTTVHPEKRVDFARAMIEKGKEIRA